MLIEMYRRHGVVKILPCGIIYYLQLIERGDLDLRLQFVGMMICKTHLSVSMNGECRDT